MTGTLLCEPGDPQWSELRRAGITATDITVIAGLVSWDSPFALYHRKLGTLPEVEQTDRMRLGLWLEGAIAQHWQRSMKGRGDLLGPGLYRSKARRWQLATPDHAVSLCDSPARIGAVLEVKTTSQRDGWGESGTADVPPYVRAQVLWQMDTVDVPVGHVAVVFLPSGEYRSYTIRHDHGWRDEATGLISGPIECLVCADTERLRQLGHEFFRRLAGELPPPDIDDLAVTTEALKLVYPGGQAAPVEITDEQLEAYDLVTAAAREADALKRESINEIRAIMGNADTATVDGRPVFRRQFSKVEGYTVAPYERDTIKRIKGGE